uniref:Mor transcription activator family protein n=1 Tax=Vibrio harveyi TaxID=669 RepID=UPI0018C22F47|nr:Mor transcription activator family protein [Vibrio harveyi]
MEWSDLVERDGFLDLFEDILNNQDGTVGEFYSVLKGIATKHNIDEKTFILLFVALCDFMGGMAIYFPKKTKLDATIKKHLIYSEFNGRNHSELARKYRVSENTVRQYIRETEETMEIVRTNISPYLSQKKEGDVNV